MMQKKTKVMLIGKILRKVCRLYFNTQLEKFFSLGGFYTKNWNDSIKNKLERISDKIEKWWIIYINIELNNVIHPMLSQIYNTPAELKVQGKQSRVMKLQMKKQKKQQICQYWLQVNYLIQTLWPGNINVLHL